MMNEARMPPDVNAENAETPAATQVPEPMPVLSVNDAGAVSARKRGKSGPAAKKGATAAKRKPEKKKPTGKTAKKKTASRAGDARFKSTTAAKGSWKTEAKRTSGSKPTAAQKKTPIKKSSARKAAPAAKKGQAKRATGRR
jgi:hypothetical protein